MLISLSLKLLSRLPYMVGDFTGVIKVIDLELGRLSQVSG